MLSVAAFVEEGSSSSVSCEGEDVLVMASNRDEPFDLAEAEIAELEARVRAVDRGEVQPVAEVIQKLRSTL